MARCVGAWRDWRDKLDLQQQRHTMPSSMRTQEMQYAAAAPHNTEQHAAACSNMRTQEREYVETHTVIFGGGGGGAYTEACGR